MGIVNVKVGSLEVPMDLEFESDLRSNIQYIGKILGFSPASLRSSSPTSNTGHKFDLRKKNSPVPFSGGKSLKGAGIHEYRASAGETNGGLPFSKAQTIELFDPNDPGFEPPYPMNPFGISTIPQKIV
jgi:hypothetical protein